VILWIFIDGDDPVDRSCCVGHFADLFGEQFGTLTKSTTEQTDPLTTLPTVKKAGQQQDHVGLCIH